MIQRREQAELVGESAPDKTEFTFETFSRLCSTVEVRWSNPVYMCCLEIGCNQFYESDLLACRDTVCARRPSFVLILDSRKCSRPELFPDVQSWTSYDIQVYCTEGLSTMQTPGTLLSKAV